MKSEIDVEKIQRKVYMSYFQDGLWDVVLGLFLLCWGFTVLFDIVWLPGAISAFLFWLALSLKRKITYPRIGYAKLAEQRKRMLRIVIAGVIVILLVVMVPLLLFTITGGKSQFLRDYFELIFGSMLAVAVGLVGYWWRTVRWYIYATLVFIFAVFNQWLALSFELSFIIPGGIITACGLIILVQFLRKYPGLSEGEFDEKR